MVFDYLKQYKDLHKNGTGVLFGSGPSLNRYSHYLIQEGATVVRVGLNSVIHNNSIDLDYFFCCDDETKRWPPEHPRRAFWGRSSLEETIFKGVTTFCVTAIDGNRHPWMFTSSERRQMNAIPIELTKVTFKKDISSHPMYNYSICFPAIQFLLYTGVSKVYLVGCDAGGGHAWFLENEKWPGNTISPWRKFKKFHQAEYPEVKIVSINPVGLKGMFDDVTYQDKILLL